MYTFTLLNSHTNIHTKYPMQGLVKFTAHKSSLQDLLEDVFQQIEKRGGVNTFIKPISQMRKYRFRKVK